MSLLIPFNVVALLEMCVYNAKQKLNAAYKEILAKTQGNKGNPKGRNNINYCILRNLVKYIHLKFLSFSFVTTKELCTPNIHVESILSTNVGGFGLVQICHH